MGWTDVCRAKNGGMKCDSADACQACKDEAATSKAPKVIWAVMGSRRHWSVDKPTSEVMAHHATKYHHETTVTALEERVERLEKALSDAGECLDGEPEYHEEGMGCGLEDHNITDRYEAMAFGWERASDRIYGEHINEAADIIRNALKDTTYE